MLLLRYDAIEEFNVDRKAECGQLNLAHETEDKNIKRRNYKTSKGQCPSSPVQVQDP